jgi:Fe-S cluster assembly protein SufD
MTGLLNNIIRIPENTPEFSFCVEANAEAVIVSAAACKIDIVLKEGARLEILRVASDEAASALKVRQAKDSSLRSFFFTRGGVAVKEDVHVALEGDGAEAFINGLHYLASEATAQSIVHVEHIAPRTTSDQLYKSILRDKARSVFNGRIIVRREAQLTNAYQLNKNLLLSSEARVDTKPELEIFADDVKCSHGAATGQLDEDQLFYLQTRGIDKPAAAQMLVHGFVEDVLDRIKNPALRQEIDILLGENHV